MQRRNRSMPADPTIGPAQRQPQGRALEPDELQWQREKQGRALEPDELQWQREKQGAPIVPHQPYNPAVPTGYAQSAQPSLVRQHFVLLAILTFLLLAIPLAAGAYLVVTSVKGQQSVPSVATVGVVDVAQATRNAEARAVQTAGGSNDTQTQLYTRGKAAFDSSDWSAAISAFENIQPSNPNYTEVVSMLTAAYVSQATAMTAPTSPPSAMTEALTLLNKAKRLNPQYPSIDSFIKKADLYIQGYQAYTGNDWQKAHTALSTLVQLDPKYKDVAHLDYICLVRIGDTYIEQNLTKQAKDAYTAAVNLGQPDDLGARAKLAALTGGQNPLTVGTPATKGSPQLSTPSTTPGGSR